MYLVEYSASEPHIDAEELDLDLTDALDFKQATEVAEKELLRAHPEVENVEIISIKEI